MRIVIAHLYYDICNLYGENGNVMLLQQQLGSVGLDVLVKKLSIQDELNFDEYDFIYIGSGTNEALALAQLHINKYKDEFKAYIDSNKFALITGSATALLAENTSGICSYTLDTTAQRVVCECLFTDKDNNYIIGFQNRDTSMTNIDANLFTVKKGIGSSADLKNEGFKHNNLFLSYVIGPILVRNPYFAKSIIKSLVEFKQAGIDSEEVISLDFDFNLEISAYNKALSEKYDIIL